ncbi:MAG: substrate-binding domain-containing protein [Victivallaceae bacterium]|jgi:DNA-binding LacI/PurR family transcriptional regulator
MSVQEISCLWEKVTEELAEQIKNKACAAGDRFYSADEISARFGVSNITSRRVLSELARMNLIQKSRGRGCVINKSHQLKTIYVMFHDKEISTSNLGYVRAGLYKGVVEESIRLGCETKVVTLKFLERAQHGERFDLLIVQNFPEFFKEMADLISNSENINCSCCHALHPIRGVSTVRNDFVNGGYMATSHLIERGHRRIAMITTGDEWGAGRFEGYFMALKDNGICFESALLKNCEINYASTARAMAELMAMKNPPTAVFAMSDTFALFVFDYCSQNNIRIPGGLAVIGFDNTSDSEIFNPPLTSVDTHWAEQGRLAVRLLAEDLPKDQVKDIVVKADLVIRKSV